MQHIASRASLKATNDVLLTTAESLDEAKLTTLGFELESVADLLLNEVSLRRTLSETTLDAGTRENIAARLLSGKVSAETLSVVTFAVSQHWSSSRELQEAMRLVGRTAMFRRAERTSELDEVEDQLFRFSRIVDASPELSVILDDPAANPSSRSALVHRLLAGKAHPLVTELLDALARDTAGRSFTHGVRELVDQAAQRQEKVVAIVKAAIPLTAEQTTRLVASLGRIYGREVSAHIEIDPSIVGGMRVQVGDEVIDGSVAGRLETLSRRMAG